MVLLELKIKDIQSLFHTRYNGYISQNGIVPLEGTHKAFVSHATHELLGCFHNIRQCINEATKVFKPLKRKYGIGSYAGKHIIEDYRNCMNLSNNYISNGEFILAMILAGYEYKVFMDYGRPCVNCSFRVAKA